MSTTKYGRVRKKLSNSRVNDIHKIQVLKKQICPETKITSMYKTVMNLYIGTNWSVNTLLAIFHLLTRYTITWSQIENIKKLPRWLDIEKTFSYWPYKNRPSNLGDGIIIGPTLLPLKNATLILLTRTSTSSFVTCRSFTNLHSGTTGVIEVASYGVIMIDKICTTLICEKQNSFTKVV